MSDTNIEPPPTQLGFLGRIGKGIFIKPKDSQIFETNLDHYKETSSENPDTGTRWWGYDYKRFSKIGEIKKKIAKAINNYLKSYNKVSPITFENDTISGINEPFEKALTKITITNPNNVVTEYTDQQLQELKNKYTTDNYFSWFKLTKDISHKDGGFVGTQKAKLTFELDMSKLLSPSSGGRRSFRKNYKKVKSAKRGRSAKRASAAKSSRTRRQRK
jgi:hypothetical protein